MSIRLEQCQTRKYHEDCGHHHTKVIDQNMTGFLGIPMLAIIQGCIKIIDYTVNNNMLPSIYSVINCKGDVMILPTWSNIKNKKSLSRHISQFIGTILKTAADEKDLYHYAFRFKGISDDFNKIIVTQDVEVDDIKGMLSIFEGLFVGLE